MKLLLSDLFVQTNFAFNMELATNHTVDISCECLDLVNEFLNLSKKIFAIEDKRLQWKILRKFLSKHLRKDSTDLSKIWCAQDITSFLLRKIKIFKRKGITAPNLLLNIMTCMYFKNCIYYRDCLTWHLYEIDTDPFCSDNQALRVFAALHGNLNFITLLVNYGYLSSSLPKDSSCLRKEANDLILNFM